MVQIRLSVVIQAVAIHMLITTSLATGTDDGYCSSLAIDEGWAQTESPQDGLTIHYVPYLWCKENCAGWTPFPESAFILLLFQFILPAIIFSTVIPRRWHFDMPDIFFDLRGRGIIDIAKLCISFVMVAVVASIDMIGWITCIMTLAGPMLLSGVQEMLLDYRTITHMKHNAGGSAAERLEVIAALLCGNFDQEPNDPKPRISSSLVPLGLTDPQQIVAQSCLDITKSRMISILNAQMSFGSTVGIPAIFFLGGFLYNALGITTDTALGTNWVPFAVLWMLLVNVAVVSGTLLAGNNPNTVSVLIAEGYIAPQRPWYSLWVDYYEAELYPVSMWNRGISKYRWLQTTQRWRNTTSPLFRDEIELGRVAWTIITVATSILIIVPCVLAYCMAYYLPFARQGCRTLSYGIYIGCQLFLMVVALGLHYRGLSYSDLFHSQQSASIRAPLWVQSVALRVVIILFVGVSIGLSAFITFAGTIFQFFGIYNNCFCQTSVPTWTWPAEQRITFIAFDVDDDYKAYLGHLAASMTWVAAAITGALCYFGWWYQRALRASVKQVIEEIHL